MRNPSGAYMIFSYANTAGKLTQSSVAEALWIDLCKPEAEEAAAVAPFVPEVPSLADLEEIEISARLYREGPFSVMTVMVPGISREDDVSPITGPVAFILGQGHLVTVRYHSPRPFETYAPRAEKVGLGCEGAERVFLGLCEEIIGRIADLLELSGKALDGITRQIFTTEGMAPEAAVLQKALIISGQQSDMVGNCRLSLLTIERALSFFLVGLEDHGKAEVLQKIWMEPSGEAFNSISLQAGTGRPCNPMINAGAIATTGLVHGKTTEQKIDRILDVFSRYAGRKLGIDESIYRCESETGHRNRAIGHMLRNFDILTEDPTLALEAYFKQCSV